MQTLYDLLGALPDDDADRLRAAFRKAAKASHPDNNPDDRDAPHKFRRIVRAHGILGDERQRATYDWLLAVVDQQRGLDSKRNTFASEARSLLPNAIAGAAIAFVSIGAFLMFGYMSGVDIVPARVQGMTARASALAAAMPAQRFETIGQAVQGAKLDDVAVAARPDAADPVRATPPPSLAAATDNTATIPAAPDVAVKDAGYYRQQGSVAYHSGDLPLALIDFDRAIDLDPNSSDAYIDRAIVFHRMGDLKRAFADIAKAKRIDDLSRTQTPPIKPKQALSNW
jgi:tetratricopeptide (TPR) repeat protein